MSTATPKIDPSVEPKEGGQSFAETAMRLSGKSEEEARRLGAVDKADEQVEKLFEQRYRTSNSPVHRAVWDGRVPLELFAPPPLPASDPSDAVMKKSLDAVKRRLEQKTIHDERGKLHPDLLRELGEAGYWGLLIEPKYGGQGISFQRFTNFLTKLATYDAMVAGMASIHGCIGAVDPVRTFGTEEQKQRFLPRLASGEKLSAFALTEPCAGSDLTALRTRARLDGGRYLVTGEKLFITNVVPGRTIGLVCLIDDKPAVLIADLPDRETEQFKLVTYGLHALKHTYNRGMIFRDLPVPAENLLRVAKGNGLTIA